MCNECISVNKLLKDLQAYISNLENENEMLADAVSKERACLIANTKDNLIEPCAEDYDWARLELLDEGILR
jgi:hypothetical protein